MRCKCFEAKKRAESGASLGMMDKAVRKWLGTYPR